VVKRIPLLEAITAPTSPSSPGARRATLLLIKNYVWIPVGAEIHIVSVKVFSIKRKKN
jgi:hypothetical protein